MKLISRNLGLRAAGVFIPAALLLGLSARAEESVLRPDEDHKGIYTLALENDLFSGSDDNYTNGVRVAFLSAENNFPTWLEEGANALPFLSAKGHKRWHIAFGQSMFTPHDLTQTQLQIDDRPYAGWLYGSLGLISDTGYRLDNLQLSIGMVGPASLAAQTQRFVHDVIDTTRPEGWDHQLHDEPGLMLTYERKWRNLYEFSPFGWGVDITPSLGGSIGNVYTHAAAGAVIRFGYDLPSDYGPPLIRPNLPGSDFFSPNKDVAWYLFAGFEGRAVARNIFLDGNTFQDSHRVDKYPLVGGLQAGIAFTFENTRLAYTHILRTREFHGQPEADSFGAITLSRRF